ncbi:replication-relaxation family protein [Acinetobacter baumannii]|uniref:replication-relaxation family protein n=1 Tax=Acinetobacter baumannii TaxID=470 RepID=UPI002706D6F3|nr:replication-relaxation family protein [Acinetobacter baumannii]MDO7359574.1 replication-relaxation family protein [Acinetobacter baumannii]
MKVIKRNKDLKYNIDIAQEKIKITLLWIYEFKFTNTKVVEILLGIDGRHARTFIKNLVEKDFLFLFKNKNLDGKNYFYGLTQFGIEYLQYNGLLDDTAKRKNISSLQKSMSIVHDLVVQKYIALNISNYKEVFSESSLYHFLKKEQILADAIVVLEDGMRIAIEYERWAKTKDRIYFNFYRHYENIFIHDHYDGCIYLFENDIIKNTYQKLFDQDHWVRYKLNKTTSKLYMLTETFDTKKDQNIKDAFILKTFS